VRSALPGLLAGHQPSHAVRAGGCAEILGPACEALHGAVTVGRLDLRAGRITGRTTLETLPPPLLQDRPAHHLRPGLRAPIQRTMLEGLQSAATVGQRSEEHTSELQSRENLVCRLLLEKKKKKKQTKQKQKQTNT